MPPPPKTDAGTTRPPRLRERGVFDALTASEARDVLRRLLERHNALRAEAEELALKAIARVDRHSVAAAVQGSLLRLGHRELSAASGRAEWGYVEPAEAAWQLLEEAFALHKADLERLLALGLVEPAPRSLAGLWPASRELDRIPFDVISAI